MKRLIRIMVGTLEVVSGHLYGKTPSGQTVHLGCVGTDYCWDPNTDEALEEAYNFQYMEASNETNNH